MSQYWAACYTKPLAERDAQRAIEDLDFGTMIPSYRRGWYDHRDQFRSRTMPLMPGYVLVSLTEGDDSWNAINADNPHGGGEFEYVTQYGEIITVPVRGNAEPDAFCRVLINAGQPSRITEVEMIRLTLAHARGDYNVFGAPPAKAHGMRRYSKRRRRPRPGRMIRNQAYMGTGAASC